MAHILRIHIHASSFTLDRKRPGRYDEASSRPVVSGNDSAAGRVLCTNRFDTSILRRASGISKPLFSGAPSEDRCCSLINWCVEKKIAGSSGCSTHAGMRRGSWNSAVRSGDARGLILLSRLIVGSQLPGWYRLVSSCASISSQVLWKFRLEKWDWNTLESAGNSLLVRAVIPMCLVSVEFNISGRTFLRMAGKCPLV